MTFVWPLAAAKWNEVEQNAPTIGADALRARWSRIGDNRVSILV